jgi:HSP20 family protein
MFTNTELTRFEPRAFMRRVFRDFDRFFEPGDWPVARLGKPFADVAWIPPVEAFERDHRLTVRVELPGMKKEEIAVTFAEGFLTIEGERKLEKEEEKKNEWYRNERTYGKFVRTVPLPEGVKATEVKATFESGDHRCRGEEDGESRLERRRARGRPRARAAACFSASLIE